MSDNDLIARLNRIINTPPSDDEDIPNEENIVFLMAQPHIKFLKSAIGGFRREVQPRRQHWFLNEKAGFPFRTPAFCSVFQGTKTARREGISSPFSDAGGCTSPQNSGISKIGSNV
jgi:hypothetical protein